LIFAIPEVERIEMEKLHEMEARIAKVKIGNV